MTFRFVAIVVVSVLGPASSLIAQQAVEAPPPNLPSGVRARVWSTTFPGAIRGILMRSDAKAVYVSPEAVGTLSAVPLESITRLDLALAEKRNLLKGTVIGAAIGLGLGVGWKVDPTTCHDPSSTDFCSRGEAIGGGALGGAALGALIGFLIKTDRFTTMDLESFKRAPAPAVRQSRAHLAFGVTFRF
jgi:hypothetical protein